MKTVLLFLITNLMYWIKTKKTILAFDSNVYNEVLILIKKYEFIISEKENK